MNSTCELGRHAARALKPYPAYKDSRIAWLGEVPEHWEVKRGKALFRCVNVRSSTGEETLLTVSSERGVVPRSSATVTMFKAESYVGYKLCWPGDLVINSLWAWGRGLGVSRHHGIISSAYGVYRLRPPYTEYFSYVHALVRSTPFNWELQVRSKGIWISRLQLTDEAFLGAPAPLPPLHEQAAIVRFLDHADRRIRRYIRAKEKLIALLEEQKQTIIHRAVTRGLDPNVRLKPSGVEWLGDVPEHWRLPRLGALLRERGETNGDGQVSEVLSVLRERGVIPYAEKGNIGNKKSEDITRYKVVRPDDIVVNCMNVIIGSVGLSRYTGCLSPVYYVLTRRSERDHPRYLNAYFQTKPFQESLVRIGNGILAHRMRIPMELLKCEPFPRPPFEEQAAIVSFLDRVTADLDAATTSAQRETSLLREYHTRFIADVVTGKLDVRAAAAGLPDEVKEPEPFDETSALIDGEEEPSDDLDAVPEEAEEV